MSGTGGGKRPSGGDSPPGPPEKKSKKEEKTTTTLIEPIRIAGVSSTVSKFQRSFLFRPNIFIHLHQNVPLIFHLCRRKWT